MATGLGRCLARRLPCIPVKTFRACVLPLQRPPARSLSAVSTRRCFSSGSEAGELANARPSPTTLNGQPLDRLEMNRMLINLMFYTQSFEVYGGVSGLYDHGPPGCALQANIIDAWRKHFVVADDMLEMDCSILTPHAVLEASGHVDKFADWMCRDPRSSQLLRADHFVKEVLEQRLADDRIARDRGDEQEQADQESGTEKAKVGGQKAARLSDTAVWEYKDVLAQIDNYDGTDLAWIIKQHDLRNPITGARPKAPVSVNLMFATALGMEGGKEGGKGAYLRPETAQGQFLNFPQLLAYNRHQMPFASASVGKAFRNEISPRSGLLRAREFTMAEIEHFVDPEGGKKHRRFSQVADVELDLLDRETQLAGETTIRTVKIGDAVKGGIVDNETLGYFMARIGLFLQKIGVDMSKVRFRQHMDKEMAHYARDCWDAELLTSHGWIECVGCADRSAHDLTMHSKRGGKSLVVRENLQEPRVVEEWTIEINRGTFGPKFKDKSKDIKAALYEMTQQQRASAAHKLNNDGTIAVDVPGLGGGAVELDTSLITISWTKRTENMRTYVPDVIEPSFGIGRLLYCLLEHNYWLRSEDDVPSTKKPKPRQVLSLAPLVAPNTVMVAPVTTKPEFDPFTSKISDKLKSMNIRNRVDGTSATLGKRYSREDSLGTPFSITVDSQTIQDGTVTLRDRDSTRQVRAAEDKILGAVRSLVDGQKAWKDIEAELPIFEPRAADPSSD